MTLLLQAVIALTSAGALVMASSDRVRIKRLGCITGLLGQPAWWFEAWRGDQWGVLLTAVLFTLIYASGLVKFWRAR